MIMSAAEVIVGIAHKGLVCVLMLIGTSIVFTVWHVFKDIWSDTLRNSHHSSQCSRGVYCILDYTIEYLLLSSYRCSSCDTSNICCLVSVETDYSKKFLTIVWANELSCKIQMKVSHVVKWLFRKKTVKMLSICDSFIHAKVGNID